MNLKSCLLLVLVLVTTTLCAHSSKSNKYGSCPNLKTSLNTIRKRRHLAFPQGSSVVLSMAGVKTIMTHVPSGWYLAVEIDVLFKLPDAEFVAAHKRRVLYHRQKKEAWTILQNAFDDRNMNGRACILRSICEAQMHLAPKGKSLVHDILRSMFSTHLNEDSFAKEIGETHGELFDAGFCEKPNDCPFSFLQFILDLNKKV